MAGPQALEYLNDDSAEEEDKENIMRFYSFFSLNQCVTTNVLMRGGLTRRADVTCNPEVKDGSTLRTNGLFWVWFKVEEKERLWVTGAE